MNKIAQSKPVAHATKSSNPFFGKEGVSHSMSPENASQTFFQSSGIQAKLSVNQPNDPFEREADAVADSVIQRLQSNEGADKNAVTPAITPLIQTKPVVAEQNEEMQQESENEAKGDMEAHKKSSFQPPDQPEENPFVQRKPIFESKNEFPVHRKESGTSANTVSSSLESRLSASKGSGSALPESVRTGMEQAMGADFSGVRVHTGSHAAGLSNELNAQAFAHGNDIYFNSGKYEPSSREGQHLLAHELTHTVQQRASGPMTNSIQREVKDKEEDKDIKDMDSQAIQNLGEAKEGYIKKEKGKIEVHFKRFPAKQYASPFLTKDDKGNEYISNPPFLKPTKERKTKQGYVWKSNALPLVTASINSLVTKKNVKGPLYMLTVQGNKNISVTGSVEQIAKEVVVPFWTLDGKSVRHQIEHKVDWQIAGGNHDVDVISNLILLDSKENIRIGQTVLNSMKTFYNKVRSFYQAKKIKGLAEDFAGASGQYEIYSDDLVSESDAVKGSLISISNMDPGKTLNPLSDKVVDIMDENIKPGFFSLKTSMKGGGNIVPYKLDNEFIKVEGDAKNHKLTSITLKNVVKDENGVLDKNNPDKELSFTEESQDHFKVKTEGYSAVLKDIIRGVKAMSPIEWEEVDFSPLTGWNAVGRIKTDIELLDKANITLSLENSRFTIESTITSDALKGKLPKPFDIDYSSITVSAGTANPLSVTGALGFSIDKVGKGRLSATAGVNKFGLEGNFLMDQIKGLKKAEIGFKYYKLKEGTRWEISGEIEVAKGSIKGVDSASVNLKYDGKTLWGEGNAKLSIPGIDTAKLKAAFSENGDFSFSGEVQLKKLPGIKSGLVEVTIISKEGEGMKLGVKGEAEPDLPKVPELHAKLTVSYLDGVFEMKTKVKYKKGKFTGTIEVGITNKQVNEKGEATGDPSEKGELVIFGFGEIAVEVYKGINGTVKVRLTPAGDVMIGGIIEAKNLKPFGDGYSFEKDLLKFPRIKIPLVGIPGLSIFAFIDGGVHFKFNWDPLVLKLLKIDFKETNIEELDKISIDITGDVGSQAHAEVYMSINAGLGAEVLIASLTGSIGGEAGLALDAEAGGKLDASWDMEKGLKLKEIRAYLNVTPKAIFRLTGSVSVDLDLWLTTVNLYYHKWVFAEQELDLSGLTLNIDFPIKFKEEGGIELPSYETMNVQKPDFSGDQGQKVLDTAINGDAEKELARKKQEIREKVRYDLRNSTNDEDFTPSKYTEKMMDKYDSSPEMQAFVKTTIEEESSILEHESFEKEKQRLRTVNIPVDSKFVMLDMFFMFHQYITKEEVDFFKAELRRLEEEKKQSQANAVASVPAPVQAKAEPSANTSLSSIPGQSADAFNQTLDYSAGRGVSLPHTVSSEMKDFLGADFSGVTIHNDAEANALSSAIGAQAFTYGNDIYFNRGKYEPGTKNGKHLLAHELTHTLQQAGGGRSLIQKQDEPADAGITDIPGGVLFPPIIALPVFDFESRHESFARFDATYTPVGPVPTEGEFEIQLWVHINFENFSRARMRRDPYRNHRFTREQLNDFNWTDDEKAKFETDFMTSVESAWSEKHKFHLQDPAFSEYLSKVRVIVITVSEPTLAHTRINALKVPAGAPRFRSFVSGSEATLDIRDPSVPENRHIDPSDIVRQIGSFEFDSSVVTDEMKDQIREVSAFIIRSGDTNPDNWSIGLTGRASSEGAVAYNQKLGGDRAEAVRVELFSQLGWGEEVANYISVLAGERNATEDPKFRRVDLTARRTSTSASDITQNVAAHEAGHMFGLGDEYVRETDLMENETPKFLGDRPSHYDKVESLMGKDAADELLIQNNDSIMSHGNNVRRGHYVNFLEAINTMTGKQWNVE